MRLPITVSLRRMTELDDFDRRLLSLLQENSRLTGMEMSRLVGLSPAACLRRVQRLRETGVIEREVALVSPAALGRKTTIIVLLTLDRDRPDTMVRMREWAKRTPEVIHCYHVTGPSDFVLTIVTAGMEEYSRFVDRHFYQPYIKRYESLAVLGDFT